MADTNANGPVADRPKPTTPNMATHPWLIVVVAQQRSGTTAFGRTLAQGQKIHTFGEVFHNARGNSQVNYFNFRESAVKDRPWISFPTPENQEQLWRSYLKLLKSKTGKPFVLLDAKYNSWHHFNAIWYLTGEAPAMVHLVKKGRVKIVHLIRRNLFAQACSAILAEQRQQFHFSESPEAEPNSLTLNPHGVLARMQRSQLQTEKFRKFFIRYDHYCELFYEDMFEDKFISKGALQGISNLIGEDCDGERELSLSKATPPLQEVISNSAEVLSFFAKTRFNESVVNALSNSRR